MLYSLNHPYYSDRNQGIELFVVSIITIVTGIYDSRWRVFSRPRFPEIARKYIPKNSNADKQRDFLCLTDNVTLFVVTNNRFA